MIKNNFNLDLYLSRFLAGDINLKTGRHFSQNRLALFRCGAENDFISEKITKNSKKYYDALQYLKSLENIKHDNIFHLNKMLNESNDTYRNEKIFIGKNINEALYIPPNPNDLESLMNQLLITINSNEQGDFKKAFYVHSQFLLIHPFYDSNGRIARLLFDYLIDKKSYQIINPALFRLNKSTEDYIKAIHNCSLDNEIDKFYLSVKGFSKNTGRKIEHEIDKANQEMVKILIFRSLSFYANEFLKYLCNTPIMSAKQINSESKLAAVNELLELGIIQKTKTSKGGVNYVCKLTMNLLIQLEKTIIY
jgi:Fic family protein